MNNIFIGRKKELQALQWAYSSERSEFIPVYGRRRVGKSELILHFGKDKPFLYYMGKNAPEMLQIREFLNESARVLKEPLLASMAVDGWKKALEAVVERTKGPAKLVLAFDEYQWVSAASPSLSSILQELWDRKWSRQNKVLLILCGSYLGFMEREVLGNKSPLFGRRTGQILLHPFDFREAALFHPRYSLRDQARAYFFCGGIPLYLNYFSSKDSIENNIMGGFLDEHAPLFREPAFLLGEELRELDCYYGILLALASGSSTGAKLAALSGIPERSLHYYLNHLINLGYIKRRYPTTGKKPMARHVRYCLNDPLLRFWFRFIYPHESSIVRMGPDRAFLEHIQPELESFSGTCFEGLCREALLFLYEKEGITAEVEIGEYWSPETQIDIVGIRKDGWTDLGECRWGAVRSVKALEGELEEKAGRFPNYRNATIGKMIFSRDPIPGRLRKPEFKYYSLADLYVH